MGGGAALRCSFPDRAGRLPARRQKNPCPARQKPCISAIFEAIGQNFPAIRELQANRVCGPPGGIAESRLALLLRVDAGPHQTGRAPQATNPSFFKPGLPYPRRSPSRPNTCPPAASSTACPAAVSHSIVVPKRG